MVNRRIALMRYRADDDAASRHTPAGNGRVPRMKALTLALPHGAKLRATGLSLPSDLDLDAWAAVGVHLAKLDSGIQWALGDWWVYGDHKYGERVAVVNAKAIPYEFESLMNLGRVARGVQTSLRREVLSFSHHAEVAKFEPKTQAKWLDMAARFKWSVRELRRSLQEHPPRQDGQGVEVARREAESLRALAKRITNLLVFDLWEPPRSFDWLDDTELRDTVERIGRAAKALTKVAVGLGQYRENRLALGKAFVPRPIDPNERDEVRDVRANQNESPTRCRGGASLMRDAALSKGSAHCVDHRRSP